MSFRVNLLKFRESKTYKEEHTIKRDGRVIEKEIVKSFTQDDLAGEVGVPQSTVAFWENGSRVPNFNQIILLCRVFKCTPNDLLGGEF